jgi:hypothetical protein
MPLMRLDRREVLRALATLSSATLSVSLEGGDSRASLGRAMLVVERLIPRPDRYAQSQVLQSMGYRVHEVEVPSECSKATSRTLRKVKDWLRAGPSPGPPTIIFVWTMDNAALLRIPLESSAAIIIARISGGNLGRHVLRSPRDPDRPSIFADAFATALRRDGRPYYVNTTSRKIANRSVETASRNWLSSRREGR